MKVLHVNHSDINGGAARAVYRLHSALRSAGVRSEMLVAEKMTDDHDVLCPGGALAKLAARLKSPVVQKGLNALFSTTNKVLHSPAFFSSHLLEHINKSDADVINLHWINGETLSVSDIARIKKPLVWTIHDMWPFCGAEHVTTDRRWVDGYLRSNRPSYESGFDVNRWVWNRKAAAWFKPFHIVTPSLWMADNVRNSVIFNGWPIETIPNVIDTQVWKILDKQFARKALGLPLDKKLVAFGSFGANGADHKGFDLLIEALKGFTASSVSFDLVVYGQSEPAFPLDIQQNVRYMGHLRDEVTMCLLFNAVDVVIIPSRVDNFPSSGIEAFSCGTPVVAFRTCGLTDIVEHKVNGYLADPFMHLSLKRGIEWVLEDSDRFNSLGMSARKRAEQSWSPGVVVPRYISLYERVVSA